MKKFAFIIMLAVLAACAPEKMVIVQIADAQLGFMGGERAKTEGKEWADDLSYEVEYLKKAIEVVNDIKPDAVVFTGDQVHRAKNENQWNTFIETISAIDKSVACLHIPGNHDFIVKKNKIVDTEDYFKHFPEDRFTYRGKGVNLVGINSNLIKYDDSLETAQKEWIRKAAAKEKADEVTILFSHHPFFLNEIGEEDGYFQIQQAKREEYFNLFVEMGVNALYAGHLHNCAGGQAYDIPVTTTTSVAYQIGESQPSIRIITVENGKITDELRAL